MWGSTYVSNLQKIIVLPKKILRMIPRSGFRDHTDPLFKNLSSISHLKDSFLRSLTPMLMEQGRMKGYMLKSDLVKASISYRGEDHLSGT